MITICIPDTPPSNNEFLGKNKRFQYATAKQHWEKMVYAYGRNLKPDKPYHHATVHIHYTFPDKRRRDPDNYSGKMLLDPLTKLGIIRDDNFGAIRLELSAESEKGKRETKIMITEG